MPSRTPVPTTPRASRRRPRTRVAREAPEASAAAGAGRRAAKTRAVTIASAAAPAGTALTPRGAWPEMPRASRPPATTSAPRKTAYCRTRKLSSVLVAPRVPRPARRRLQSVRAAPPTPAVGSSRVAPAPPSVM